MIKSFNDKEEYLQNLFIKLEEIFSKQEVLNFKLIKAVEKGFKIKVGGLYGFVSFAKMPWFYNDYSYWASVAPYLTGLILKGKIFRLDREKFSILVKASSKISFDLATLNKDQTYKGVVLKEADYGFFMDLGISFSWLKGSLLGLMHKSNCPIESKNWKEGDVVDCKIHSIEGESKVGLVHPSFKNVLPLIQKDELNELVGTVHKGKVIVEPNGEKRLLIADKYLGLMPIRRKIYPGQKMHILKLVSKLEGNAVVNCLVLKANHKKKLLIVKFLPENVE